MAFWKSMTVFPWELIPFADSVMDRGGLRQLTAVSSSKDGRFTYMFLMPIPGLASSYFVPNDGRKLFVARRCG
jgi:hypothetical protein